MRHPIRPYSGGEVVIVRDINSSLFSHVPFILFPVSDAFILALRMRKSKGALCRNPHEGLRMVFVNFAAVSRRLPNPLFAMMQSQRAGKPAVITRRNLSMKSRKLRNIFALALSTVLFAAALTPGALAAEESIASAESTKASASGAVKPGRNYRMDLEEPENAIGKDAAIAKALAEAGISAG
jgi:zona occludens toxin (predicted ATPase)